MTLQKKLVNVGTYRLTGKRLGKGNFAKVEEAVHAILNVKVAIKVLDVTQIKEEYIIKNLHREARIMFQLRHPSIAVLFQAMQHGSTYFLVTELVGGGDLCNFIKGQKFGKLDERNTRVYARQLISAVAHMHNQGIVHRDLKMENVMMNAIRTQVKIVDFGLSNRYDPKNPLSTHCGSPEYAAPELFVPGKCYGTEVDIWSLGVIFYGMVVGQLPFITIRDGSVTPQERRKRLLIQINKGYSLLQKKNLSLVSTEFRYLIERMLVTDSDKRITISELIFNSWVTDRGKKMIVINPLLELDVDWKFSIMKQVANLLHLDLSTVQYAISSDPYGDVAGIYNILYYKIQMQKLEGDGVTRMVSNHQHLNLTRPSTILKTKNCEQSSTSNNVRKRMETIKSPPIVKALKVAETSSPRSAYIKKQVSAEEPLHSSTNTSRNTKMLYSSAIQTARRASRCPSPNVTFRQSPQHTVVADPVSSITTHRQLLNFAKKQPQSPPEVSQNSPAEKVDYAKTYANNNTVVVGTRAIPRIIHHVKETASLPGKSVKSSSVCSKQSVRSATSSRDSGIRVTSDGGTSSKSATVNARRSSGTTDSSSLCRSLKKTSYSTFNKIAPMEKSVPQTSRLPQVSKSKHVLAKTTTPHNADFPSLYASGDNTIKTTISQELKGTVDNRGEMIPKSMLNGTTIAKTIAEYLERNRMPHFETMAQGNRKVPKIRTSSTYR